jgi:hypothetical protein
MKAARQIRSLKVIQIRDVGKTAPKDDEVLIRIQATTVCAAYWRLRKVDPNKTHDRPLPAIQILSIRDESQVGDEPMELAVGYVSARGSGE